jgi:hypothetical protein
MSADFNDVRFLDATSYDLVLGDSPRAYHRSLINRLANGEAPYTEEECETNQIRVNTSDLSMPRLLHDARSQFTNGFLGQMRYFTCTTDAGPKYKRGINGGILTKEANRILKNSLSFFETQRSSFASLCLHGISPAIWETEDKAIPRAIGVEDVLIPSGTLLDFQNLPFVFVRRSFTGKELQLITQEATRDPGWNIPFVENCLDWLDDQMTQLVNQNWPEIWSPEKWEEQRKQDGGWYASDRCPTIDCFDVYGYVEKDGECGWIRRIILDSWSNPGFDPGGKINPPKRKDRGTSESGKRMEKMDRQDFLYNSGDRKVADSWQNILAFQFADLSAVAPFRYHSVRSLGWILYAVCHLRNRMYCKTQEACFEAMLQMFQVDSAEDLQRALKIELGPFAFIDKTLRPIPANERWQPNAGLIELGLGLTQQVIDQNSKSWTSNPTQQQKKERETNFQRMADLQAINALVGAGISQAYQYKAIEYRETYRRLCIEGSKDVNAQRFQARCIEQGVPEEILYHPERVDIESERMIGGGNQTIETQVSQALMEALPGFPPASQTIIRRDFVLALTKSPAKALELVPDEQPHASFSTDKAGTDVAKLLTGVPVEDLPGTNQIEYTVAQLKLLGMRVQAGMKKGMVDQKELQALGAIAQNVGKHIQIIAKDKEQKALVKKLSDALGKLVNEIKGFAQRLAQAAKAAQARQNGQNGQDPKVAAKVREIGLTGAAKRKAKAEQDAQKLGQNAAKFEMQTRQDMIEHHANIHKLDLEAAAGIRRGMFEQENEPEPDENTGGGDG